MPRICLLLLVFFANITFLRATHIVGGEMNYTCLGNNEYEITLVIFRDCYNGNPAAYFDNPASIGVFHGETNLLLQEILIPFDTDLNDTLDPVLSSECFVAPPDVCVHTTTYTALVTLPPQIGGYTLAYQRCCRNVTISNIVDPLGTGATYSVFISETALLECNSNPKFNTWPPIYICVNEPISFDQSAFDIDGDSIVYTLCTPLDGAIPADPMPQPPFNPPYPQINWIDPPYNVLNMLNGSPGGSPLTINPQTGLLTGLPNTIGQFVVGICVEEYRDGVLISTTRRDFQYNVGECGQTISSFFAPEVQCEDLTVVFDNLSQNADEYIWFFNDPGNPGASSTITEPVFTYSDTGTYTVMLIAEPNNVCADTFYQDFTLLPNSLFPDFDFEIVECADSVVIEVTDLSTDTLSSIVGWSWQFGNLQTSNEQHPVFVGYQNMNVLLTLTVTAANGCQKDISQWVPAFLIEEEIADTLQVCKGDSIPLNPLFDPLLGYYWSPGATLSNPVSPNPFASPDTTTTYTVLLISFTGCTTEKEVTVFVPEPLTLELPPDTTLCDPIIPLTAETNTGVEFYWAADPDFNVLLGFTQTILVEPFGTESYYVLVRDEYGCSITGDVTITGQGVNVEVDSSGFVCQGDTIQLQITNTDPDDVLSFDWSPDSLVFSGDHTDTPTIFPPGPGQFAVFVESVNQFDCLRIDTVLINAIDTTDLETGFASQQCNGFAVLFDYTGPNASFINWDFGDIQNPGATYVGGDPYYVYPDTGWYTIMLTLPANIACPDTAFFPVHVGNPGIQLDFGWEYPICSDSVVVQFNNLSVNNQGEFISQQWTFSNGLVTGAVSPQITLTENTILEAQLIMASSDGCVDTIQQTLEIQLMDPVLSDTIIICFQEETEINPGFNPDWSYHWAPPEGLNDPNAPNPLANPDATTTYSVTITDTGGVDTCSVVRAVTVLVPPAFDWSASADTTICEQSILLEAQSATAVSILWSFDPDFSTILETGGEYLASPGQPSVYYLQATDIFGCVLTDTITVGNYSALVSAPPAVTVCIGDSIQLNAINLQLGDVLTFEWAPEEGILSGQGTNAPWVGPTENTLYTFIAENQYGCLDTGQVLVNIFNFVPPLDVQAQPDTIPLGQSTQLWALIGPNDPAPGYQYFWSPEESLTDPNIYNPIATPTETTLYEVLIVNGDGCSNRGAVLVVVFEPVCEEPFLFIPSGFSPNGDGKNDFFRVRGNAVDEVYLAVYDRWGEKVFESFEASPGWDGTHKGKVLPPDVYGYYLRVLCFGGEEFIRKGNVSLLR